MNKDLKIFFAYLRDIIYSPGRASIDRDELSDSDHREFAEALLAFGDMVKESREFALSISKGDLDIQIPAAENELSAPLKSLHSTLRHLTWQAKQVAGGDYDQKVGFMGEFSTAFNEMIEQLEERRNRMEQKAERDKANMDRLSRTNRIFQTITSSMEEWIVMVDRETGEHLFKNHAPENVLSNDDFEQQLYEILFEYASSIEDDDEPRKELFALVSDASIQHFEMMLYPIRWFDHKAVACVLTDVTATREEYSRLEDAAYRDVITGVYNRLYGMNILDQYTNEHIPFYLVFIDMDMLKYVNDVFGHSEGDQYIISVANVLKEVSPLANVCRLGGDEFMVLIRQNDMHCDMREKMEELRNKLIKSSAMGEDGKEKYVRSMSFGIVKVNEDGKFDKSEILSLADERMYEYKKAHKKERRV